MGMPNSKFVVKEVPKDDLQEGSVPSTPIMTPRVAKLSEMDPRSPSLNIARTPLEILSAAAEKLELLDKKTPGKTEFLLGIDPRSPTTDFKRTPIFVSAAENDFPRQLHNKNIEKVRKLNLLSSPKTSVGKYSPKTPKLLESSPIKAKTSAYKRRSLAGLLETNIDYTETDLDTILQGKYQTEKNEDKMDPQIINKESDCVPETEASSQKNNVDCTSETEADCEHPAEAVEKKNEDEDEVNTNEDKEIVESSNEMLDLLDQEKEDIVDFKPTEINSETQTVNIPDQTQETADLENSDTDSTLDNPNHTRSAPASPPSNPPLSPILPEKEIKSAPVTPPVNLTADVKELDKKLTNLIYEEDLVVCPRIIKLKDQVERSPLRSCGNEPRVKSTQKLKVSDKPRKSDYAVSKIPVFKEKGKGKLVQCENTPPRNMDKRVRQKKSDWDTKDITLYL